MQDGLNVPAAMCRAHPRGSDRRPLHTLRARRERTVGGTGLFEKLRIAFVLLYEPLNEALCVLWGTKLSMFDELWLA